MRTAKYCCASLPHCPRPVCNIHQPVNQPYLPGGYRQDEACLVYPPAHHTQQRTPPQPEGDSIRQSQTNFPPNCGYTITDHLNRSKRRESTHLAMRQMLENNLRTDIQLPEVLSTPLPPGECP